MKLVEAAWNFKETQPACDSGGGGLYGSISDYAAYLSMIANDGELNGQRILSSASMIEHLKDQTTQLLPEAFRRGFGERIKLYEISAGFGRKLDVDLATQEETVDYYFWGGAAAPFLGRYDQSNGWCFCHTTCSIFI